MMREAILTIRHRQFTFSLLLLFLLFTTGASAQTIMRNFYFSPGQEFIKETTVNSTGVVERGTQKLNIVTKSTVKKSFLVTDSTSTGYALRVTIDDMDDEINTLGETLHFSSKKPINESSSIEKALRYMVDKPVELKIDVNGVILSAVDPTEVLATDTLLAFAGIQPEFFEKGTLLSLVGDFVHLSDLKKGYKWSDSTEINEQKMHTDYSIYDLNEKTTIVKLSNKSIGKMLNSNSTATYVVDNVSGIIIEKLIYTVSVGYRVAGKKLYAVSRSSNILERITQRKISIPDPVPSPNH